MASNRSSSSSSDDEETPNTSTFQKSAKKGEHGFKLTESVKKTADASTSTDVPNAMIYQKYAKRGEHRSKLTESVQKKPKLQRNLELVRKEALQVMKSGYKNGKRLVEFIRHKIEWISSDDKEIDLVEELLTSHCENRINDASADVKRYLKDAVKGVRKISCRKNACLEIQITFQTKENRMEFIKWLLCGNFSKKIAEKIYNDEFCSELATIAEDLKTDDQQSSSEEQITELQSFRKEVSNSLTINTYFYVDQLIKADKDDQEFKFTISAANFYTDPSDIIAIADQLNGYLEHEEALCKMLQPTLSETLEEKLDEERREIKHLRRRLEDREKEMTRYVSALDKLKISA